MLNFAFSFIIYLICRYVSSWLRVSRVCLLFSLSMIPNFLQAIEAEEELKAFGELSNHRNFRRRDELNIEDKKFALPYCIPSPPPSTKQLIMQILIIDAPAFVTFLANLPFHLQLCIHRLLLPMLLNLV